MTPEALLALLRSHQDGVFTVCLHVLRNSHDAEDAAQEALLKIASGAKDLRDARAFKSWLYRVTWRTAVDHLRKRATRRRIEEGSVPMSPAPLTDDQRDAIHEAMAALPDDDRLMLVEHYFEKTTIEELGRREGISDVAMGKRLEKAREKLKQGLAGAGILLAAAQVSHALESVTAATAPPGLVGSAFASKAALVAAGGTAVSAKTTGVVVAIAASLLLIALLTGSLSWILGMPAPKQEAGINGQTMTSSSPKGDSVPTTARDPGPTAATEEIKGDPVACRKALAALLPYVRTTDMRRWASDLERLHNGANPQFELLAKQFLAAAEPDLIPIIKDILAQTEADAARFLLSALLGRSHDPAAVEILKSLAAEGSNPAVIQSALYSMGLIRSPEGLAFLKVAWEQGKSKKGDLATATLKAIGLFGSDGIPLLLEEARNSKSGLYRDKSAYLFLVRGKDAVEGLKLVLETETDSAIRKGAAQALAFNLASDQQEAVTEFFREQQDPVVRGALIYGLMLSLKASLLDNSMPQVPSATADAILTQATFPSGTLDLDRALIWLAVNASPEKSAALFERFASIDRKTFGAGFDSLLREVMVAYSGRKEFEARLSSLMTESGITPEHRDRLRRDGLLRDSSEAGRAAVESMLETMRQSNPGDPQFFSNLEFLLMAKPDDAVLSSGLQAAYARCPTPEARLQLLDQLSVILYSRREASPPIAFLETILRESNEIDARMFAAYDYLSAASRGASDPHTLERIADLVGPDMKWAKESSLATGSFRNVQLAPSVIGDYYSRYGKASDIEWLRKLPETFPYPTAIVSKAREILASELASESRRAIDAIRLRN